jgi:hypothetical protein
VQVALACCLASALAGCNIDSILNDDEDTFHIRSLNLIEDSATVNILLGDTTISAIAYGGGTAFGAAHPGSSNVSFKAVLPTTFDDDDDDDDPVAIGQAVTRTFVKDTPYTLIAYGTVANPQMIFVEGLSQRDDVADDKIALQFADAAPNASQVDVYVTLPQAGVTAAQFVATVNLGEASAPLELTLVRDADDLDDDSTLTGELIVELKTAGSGTTLFKTNKITVSEQSRLLFTVANSNAPGPSTIKLVSLIGGSTGEFLDYNDTAALRFAQVSAQTPALDVTAGSSFSSPFAQNVSFRGISDYTNVKAGEVGIIAAPSATPGNFAFLEEFTATAGQTYSAYAIGALADVDAVVIADEARSVPTQNKFRFLHAASSLFEADPVDIYLRLPGETVDFDDDDTTPTFSSVAYTTQTSYLTYKAGSYDVYFASAGTSTVLLGPVPFQTTNGDIETLVLLDDENGALELMPVSDVR